LSSLLGSWHALHSAVPAVCVAHYVRDPAFCPNTDRALLTALGGMVQQNVGLWMKWLAAAVPWHDHLEQPMVLAVGIGVIGCMVFFLRRCLDKGQPSQVTTASLLEYAYSSCDSPDCVRCHAYAERGANVCIPIPPRLRQHFVGKACLLAADATGPGWLCELDRPTLVFWPSL